MENIFGGFIADVMAKETQTVDVNLLNCAGINNSVLFDAIENNTLDLVSDSELFSLYFLWASINISF